MFRELMPREHALWGWLGIPLFTVVLMVPGRSSALVAVCTLAGFGAWNAVGRWLRGSEQAGASALAAGLAASMFAIPAVMSAPHPMALAVALGLAGVAGVVVSATTGGRVQQEPSREAIGIAFFCGFALLVGVGLGASPRSLSVTLAIVLTWLWLGLWWINRSLSPHLPNRVLWRQGPIVAALALVVSAVVGLAWGPSLIGLLPLAYPLRIASSGAVSSARDARRIGLTELAWGLAVTTVAVQLV